MIRARVHTLALLALAHVFGMSSPRAEREKLARVACGARAAMVQATDLAWASCISKGSRATLTARPAPSAITYTIFSAPVRSDAIAWEHAPVTGFYKNGMASVASVRGLPNIAHHDLVVEMTVIHEDGSVHRVPHVTRTLPGQDGLEIEYTITAYAAVRVHVQLQVRGARVSCDVEPVPPLTRAWIESCPVKACLELVTDRHALCFAGDRFVVCRLDEPHKASRGFDWNHFRHEFDSMHCNAFSGFWLENTCLRQLWRLNPETCTLEDMQPKRRGMYEKEYVVGSKHIYRHGQLLLVLDRTTGELLFSVLTGASGTLSHDGACWVVICSGALVEVDLHSGEVRRRIPLETSDVYELACLFPFYCPNGDLALAKRGSASFSKIWVAPSAQTDDGAWRTVALPLVEDFLVVRVGIIRGRVALLDPGSVYMVCLQ